MTAAATEFAKKRRKQKGKTTGKAQVEKEILNYLTGSSETWQETGGQTEY